MAVVGHSLALVCQPVDLMCVAKAFCCHVVWKFRTCNWFNETSLAVCFVRHFLAFSSAFSLFFFKALPEVAIQSKGVCIC